MSVYKNIIKEIEKENFDIIYNYRNINGNDSKDDTKRDKFKNNAVTQTILRDRVLKEQKQVNGTISECSTSRNCSQKLQTSTATSIDYLNSYQGVVYKHLHPPNSFGSTNVLALSQHDEINFDKAVILDTLGLAPTGFDVTEIVESLSKSQSKKTFEYHREILTYFRQREKKFQPNPNYLQHQIEIDHRARLNLVEWLVQITVENDFDTGILYLAVSFIDRFLSQVLMARNKLELIGVTAIYLTAKYEETRQLGIEKFSSIGGLKFNTKDIVQMEKLLLKTLKFDLSTPTAYTFLGAYAVLTDMPDLLRFLTLYICELSLIEPDPYLQYAPSLMSAASLALARYLLGFKIWSIKLEEVTMYRLEELKQVFLFLNRSHCACLNLSVPGAIQVKYALEKYHKVANLIPPIITEHLFDHFVQKNK